MVAFSALHQHPFLVAAFYRDRDWRFASGNYAYLLAATATASTPAPLRQVVVLILCGGGAWLKNTLRGPTARMEWATVFFLKLLASHAAGEAPTEYSFNLRIGHHPP